MSNIKFSVGAEVCRSNHDVVGTIEQVTDSAIMVKDGDRIEAIPFEDIDFERSSGSMVILLPIDDGGRRPLEVHAEELRAAVHEVERGRVRIEKTVEHVPFNKDIELGADVVDVQHVPVGREFDELPQARQQGDTFVIPVVEEVIEISRRFRVVEEILVTKKRETRTEHIQADLRREVVDVTKIDADGREIE